VQIHPKYGLYNLQLHWLTVLGCSSAPYAKATTLILSIQLHQQTQIPTIKMHRMTRCLWDPWRAIKRGASAKAASTTLLKIRPCIHGPQEFADIH
jgi:hypothetical protein